MPDRNPTYLLPYLKAAREHGDGFGTLLWASPQTQAARFDALIRTVEFSGRLVCDAGCGRADFLDHLLKAGIRPADYVGIEAVDDLAKAAERKQRVGVRILRGDFVTEPVRLFVGAEIVVFCGSLNTIEDPEFYQTLRRAWDATAWTLVFNFLSSRELAGASHLRWRTRFAVEKFLRSLHPVDLKIVDDYMDGDCTVAVSKIDPHG